MPGDTLSQIAQKIRPDEQIKLVAVVAKLQQLNPQAFVGGNIDQLAGGALLTLPTAEQFGTMPRWDNKPGQAMAPIPQARTSRQGAGLAKISRVKAPQAKAAPAIHRPSPLPRRAAVFYRQLPLPGKNRRHPLSNCPTTAGRSAHSPAPCHPRALPSQPPGVQ